MGILSPLKEWLKGLAAPAEDPRLAYADASQRHRELMGKVRRAREKLAASKTDLETRLTEAKSRQPSANSINAARSYCEEPWTT